MFIVITSRKDVNKNNHRSPEAETDGSVIYYILSLSKDNAF